MSECNYECQDLGSGKMCGGNYTNNVFKTAFIQPVQKIIIELCEEQFLVDNMGQTDEDGSTKIYLGNLFKF